MSLMSIQFGMWNFDGAPIAREYLEQSARLLAPYAPDGGASYTSKGFEILYRPFHTTRQSRHEIQPHLLSSGAVLTWDGRLDNREELMAATSAHLDLDATDVLIVAAAYERWGDACFRKLLGDWALSVWDPSSGTLLLAKDYLGVRPLYYRMGDRQITWSTLLEPLVVCGAPALSLDEEYIAGWFSYFPAARLSPFREIRSVPPASFVSIHNGYASVHSYWQFDPGKRLSYYQDSEYEDHFRFVLDQAVRRRLRADVPIVAELSGGMDSSSIVCTADEQFAAGAARGKLDTVSYFDDTEANWNEGPFFSRVEQHRGRIGFHIDANRYCPFPTEWPRDAFLDTPGSVLNHTGFAGEISKHMTSRGSRVLLSGTGGDEALGGAPNPAPELADLLTEGKLSTFAKQSLAWALRQRKPLHQVWMQTLEAFLPLGLIGSSEYLRPPRWLEPVFVECHSSALRGYYRPLRLCGPRPSFQENQQTVEALQRQLACHNAPSNCYEKRFPFLDRDLWEFVLAIPRDQLLRPHERRSLMRRALNGRVPDEIRNRPRKAFVSRGPFAAVLRDLFGLTEGCEDMVSSSLGIVNARAFRQAIEGARHGKENSAMPFVRTLLIELWLKHVLGSPCRSVAAVSAKESALGGRNSSPETVTVVRA